MALAYRPPGVSIEEETTPNVSPLLATPASVGIVGLAQGYIERTDQVKLTGTSPVSLVTDGSLPTDASLTKVLAVKDTFDPGHAPNPDGSYRGPTNGLTGAGDDYSIDLANKTITRAAVDTPDPGDGVIPDGRIVFVTYQYVPADYYNAIRLDDLGSVQSRFGPAWKDGAIFSDLTYAAAIALENGARFVICQPLFARDTPGDPNSDRISVVVGGTEGDPGDPAAFSNPATWSDTFYSLRDIEDINVFVPVIGQSQTRKVTNAGWLAIVQVAQDHLKFLKDNDQYGIVISGQDGTTTSNIAGEFPTKASIRNDQTALAARYGGELAEATVTPNIARLTRQRPDLTSGVISVGAQYLSAALAGMLASRRVSSTLTRKQVSGFREVVDYRSKQDKNDDAASGLLVVEQKNLAVIVRHAVTADTTAVQRRELSVVRGKHRMIESLRDTIDTQVIGEIVADSDAPVYIKTVVISVLDGLKQQKDIVDYDAVEVRQLALEPTTFEVRFSYKPSFPVNYVRVVFGINMATGEVNVNVAGTQ